MRQNCEEKKMFILLTGLNNQFRNCRKINKRTKIKMMSVNQMSIYHTIMEVFNILYNKSSEQISNKYSHHDRHSLRKNTNNFLRVPEIHEHRKCTGFTYCGAKIFNSLPINIRETQDSIIFKKLVKNWIWDEIPSYWQNIYLT